MLATPWSVPFVDDGWVFELKWDGIRCLLSSDETGTKLHSRTGKDMTVRYPELAVLDLPHDIVLDGEVVALDENGHPSFELLQGRMNVDQIAMPSRSEMISYVVFDLLHDGESLVRRPLEERFSRLDELALPAPIAVGDRFHRDAGPVWDFVVEQDLEGIVAKRLGSRYQSGSRSPDWRKISHFKQLQAVVGGFTPGEGSRAQSFGALLLGLWVGDGLRFIGSVGSGFDDKSLRAIRSALDEMTIPTSPFLSTSEIPVASTWIEPRLVAMVRYRQWTKAGRVRAPSFKGFTDLSPEAANWQSEGPAGQA